VHTKNILRSLFSNYINNKQPQVVSYKIINQSDRKKMAKTFTEELRAAAGKQWDRVINHRFTTELARGDIDRSVLKKYLIQDHRFLDAFVVLLSSAIAKARNLEDRIPGCQFLGLITGKENTYFERSFEVLGCSKDERTMIPDENVTVNFCNLMREVSYEGSLG
jgi:thiaminase/transcriptional activator TenA